MAIDDDDWEDTGNHDLPLPPSATSTAITPRLRPLPASPGQAPKQQQNASARAAFAAIHALGGKFDEHAQADQQALKSIDTKITTMQLEHTKSTAAMQLEVVKASTNVDRLIATVETNAAARLRVATETEAAEIHDKKHRLAQRRETGMKVLQWIGGPLVGIGIAWLIAHC